MKGILNSEQEHKLAKIIDDALTLKGIAELADGLFFRAVITVVDDTLVDKLPEPVKENLSALATACIDEDVDAAEMIAADLLNSLIDIPGLDEDAEKLLFKGAVEIIVASVRKWIESKRD